MPAVSFVSRSFDADADGVLSGIKWTSPNLTFSFPTSASYYGAGYGEGEPQNGFLALTTAAKTAVRTVVNWYSGVSNLTFTEITETASVHATLRFARSNDPSTAWGYYPDTSPEGGDSWYRRGTYDNPTAGSYAWITYAHELGHAVGLKHGHETENFTGTTFPVLPFDHDSAEYSIMTYRSYVGSPGDGYTIANGHGPQSLMQADIAALQWMYGANYNYNNTNTTYTWSPTTGQMFINGVGQPDSTANVVFVTVWDGGGTDIYDLSNYTTNLNVDLSPGGWTMVSSAQRANLGGGQFARGNVANALLFNDNPASLIENVIGGSGQDHIRGNDANNRLSGEGNNDTVEGYAGDDILLGKGGNDLLDGGAGLDMVDYSHVPGGVTVDLDIPGSQAVGTGEGTDSFGSIEGIIGSGAADWLAGGAFDANVFLGGNGDDVLLGRWGNDSLDGGSGTDTASYANATGGVIVSLVLSGAQAVGGGEGSDTLTSIENLTGSDFGDTLTGGSGNNNLDGGLGDDTLSGGGGDDALDGGEGFDAASFGDATGAVTVDLSISGAQPIGGDEGSDTLESIERLIGSAFNDTLSGDGDANVLEGGAGDDMLAGLAGDDALDGGTGFDGVSYEDATGAVTVDLALSGLQAIGGGKDSDTLIAIESVSGSAFDDTLRGDSSANSLSGRAGNDTLWGLGGDDGLDGGSGLDTIVYSSAIAAVAVDLALTGSQFIGGGEDSDTLTSIENVVGSDFSDTLRGSDSDNTIQGGLGNDTLAGGLGSDSLFGGDGNDILQVVGNDGTLDGGAGSDQVIVLDPVGVSITVSSGVESLTGGTGNDTLSATGFTTQISINGGAGNDTVTGGTRGDWLVGGAGNDQIYGGPGGDSLFGQDGDDKLYIVGNDGRIEGGAGSDQVIVVDPVGVSITLGIGVESVAGGNGHDVLNAGSLTTQISISGGAGNDTLTGGTRGDWISGGTGNDQINGGAGSDSLFGAAGIDNFSGGDGDDKLYVLGSDGTLDGGAGFDQVIIQDPAGVIISLGTGIESAAGYAGSDSIDGSLLATALTLTGAGGNDIIHGGSASDILNGDAGDDTLFGESESDQLFGGDGNDSLYGGSGDDHFTTGIGSDVFFIETVSDSDFVLDFIDGLDVFDFSEHSLVTGMDDLTITTSGSDVLVFFDGGQVTVFGAAGLIDADDFLFA